MKKDKLGALAGVRNGVGQPRAFAAEYLAAKNRILRAPLPTQLRLTDPQSAKRLGRKALKKVTRFAKPATWPPDSRTR